MGEYMGIFQVIPVRTEAMSDYPPTGLAESVRALPEWIQLGCGDAEYLCAEKNATFLGSNMPDKMPDLSNHSSFFAEVMKENPGLYDKLKTKNHTNSSVNSSTQSSLPVTVVTPLMPSTQLT